MFTYLLTDFTAALTATLSVVNMCLWTVSRWLSREVNMCLYTVGRLALQRRSQW